MSQPVAPVSGIYPPPAIIARNDAGARASADSLHTPAPVAPVVTARMTGGNGMALAGNGWLPVLHAAQRRGLRADETERRRYRASYAGFENSSAKPAPKLERRA